MKEKILNISNTNCGEIAMNDLGTAHTDFDATNDKCSETTIFLPALIAITAPHNIVDKHQWYSVHCVTMILHHFLLALRAIHYTSLWKHSTQHTKRFTHIIARHTSWLWFANGLHLENKKYHVAMQCCRKEWNLNFISY